MSNIDITLAEATVFATKLANVYGIPEGYPLRVVEHKGLNRFKLMGTNAFKLQHSEELYYLEEQQYTVGNPNSQEHVGPWYHTGIVRVEYLDLPPGKVFTVSLANAGDSTIMKDFIITVDPTQGSILEIERMAVEHCRNEFSDDRLIYTPNELEVIQAPLPTRYNV